MSSVSNKILELMELKQVSYGELSKRTGIPKSALQRYATGETPKIPFDRIELIAKALNTSPEILLGWDKPNNAIDVTGFIDIVGRIAAGAPVLAEENIIDRIPTILKNPEEYFGLLVTGDSMIGAGIPDGAYAIIKKQNCAENGQIVACLVNGEDATLKRYREQGDSVMLLPENNAYNPILVNKKDFKNGSAKILGVLKEISVKY